jgi:steroid 5-alpha reductase family enzyme
MGFFYPFFVSGLLGNMVCGMLPLWVVSVIITNVSIVDAYWYDLLA